MNERVRQALMHMALWQDDDLVIDMSGMLKRDQAKIAKGEVLYESLHTFKVQSDSDPFSYHTVEHNGNQSTSCTCDGIALFKHESCKHMARVDICLLLRRERLKYVDPIYGSASEQEQDEPAKPAERRIDPAQRGRLSSASNEFRLLK